MESLEARRSTARTTARSCPPSPEAPGSALDDLLNDYYSPEPPPYSVSREKSAPPLKRRPLPPTAGVAQLSLDTRPAALTRHLTVPTVVDSPAELTPVSPVFSERSAASTPDTATPNGEATAQRSKFRNALDETVLFAGGLVSHPFESTRHFSVLRHSPSLVYYRGSSTSVTITIFSDAPLPPDRTLWLQRRGLSGNMGMNASALFRTNSNWIDVTPSLEAQPTDVLDLDERAWQRDIKKFLKKASGQRSLRKQTARETCLVRIPAAADDGYLRLVLCSGQGSKKSLCPSPIFRIASTSRDASVLRGASLTTLPLEVGVKVASTVAENYVKRVAAPVVAVAQSRAKKLTPAFVAREPEKMLAAKTTLQQGASTVEDRFRPTREGQYDALHETGLFDSPPEVVGSDEGPEPPFPLRFDGKVVQGTGQGTVEIGTPTANLSGVPAELLVRLGGIYIGWAAVQPRKGLQGVSHEWHGAIITVGPSPYAAPRLVPKKIGTVHLIHDFGGANFVDARLKVIIMAYLRPMPRPDAHVRAREDVAAAVLHDLTVAVVSLSREAWQAETTRDRMRAASSQRSLTDRAVGVRGQVQHRVDSAPAHWVGVRTTGAALLDKAHGTGGMYIRR